MKDEKEENTNDDNDCKACQDFLAQMDQGFEGHEICDGNKDQIGGELMCNIWQDEGDRESILNQQGEGFCNIDICRELDVCVPSKCDSCQV